MILRFHLFVSLLHSDLLPFLVQSGLWHLQIIASFEEHFFLSTDSHPGPRPGYGCLYSAIVFRPLWPSYFWQHLFYTSRDSYQIVTMSPRSSGKSQFCNDATQGGIICTLLFVRGVLYLAILVLPNVTISHNRGLTKRTEFRGNWWF